MFCMNAQEKNIGCWPLWQSHQSQTVSAVEVCSWADSSEKVKVCFIYQDSSSYQTQQWANWYFRFLKLPFSHKAGSLSFQQYPRHTTVSGVISFKYCFVCDWLKVHNTLHPIICGGTMSESLFPKNKKAKYIYFHKHNIFHPHQACCQGISQ